MPHLPVALTPAHDPARELLVAYNVRDWGLVRANLAPDCVYEEVGRPERRVEGADPIVLLFRDWAATVPDSRARIVAEIAGRGGAALEIEWLGQAIHTVLMFSLDGDRVTGLRHCYDSLAVYRALGLGPL